MASAAAAAVAGGMIDLKAYSALVVAAGLTPTEEVTSVGSIQDQRFPRA